MCYHFPVNTIQIASTAHTVHNVNGVHLPINAETHPYHSMTIKYAVNNYYQYNNSHILGIIIKVFVLEDILNVDLNILLILVMMNLY